MSDTMCVSCDITLGFETHTKTHTHTHISRAEMKLRQVFKRHTQGHCVAKSMWSEFLICNKVTCVEASYNEAPLFALEFKEIEIALSM